MYVLVFEEFEEFELAEGSLSGEFVLEGFIHPLYGDCLTGLFVFGGEYGALSAPSDYVGFAPY